MKKGKVCVFGSFIVDLMMRAPHLPIPGETVKGSIFKIGPGGKGSNQGVAAHRSGADTIMITKVGNDDFAQIAINSFTKEGMSTDFIFHDDSTHTGAALIMVDDLTGQNKIIVTLGACNTITYSDIDNSKEQIIHSDIFLTQLETNLNAMEYAINIAYDHRIPVILNPAPADMISDAILAKIDFLTPNETEASLLCGFSITNDADIRKAGHYFLGKGVKNVIFTLGENGAYLMNKIHEQRFPAFNVQVIDTTGAGDAFNGGLATALAENRTLEDAIVFANAVGGLCTTKIGTAPAMPHRSEIDQLISTQRLT